MSVRLTVANFETMGPPPPAGPCAGETEVVPRVSDLEALFASTAGKVEIESLEEGRDEQVVEQLLQGAILTVFKEHVWPRPSAR